MSTQDAAAQPGTVSSQSVKRYKVVLSKSGSETRTTARFYNHSFLIQSTANVCGGEPRVADTRITVRTLDQLHRQGETVEKLVEAFRLEAWEVEAAIEYARRNREEIDALIRKNEQA